jgi:flagellar motor protein MotB
VARAKTFDTLLNDLGTSGHARSTMVEKIRKELAVRGIRVDVDPANTVIRVPVDLLGFDSGSAEIRPQHQGSALAIGQVIGDVLIANGGYKQLDTVFVEGHTDDVPIGGIFGGNWGLSTNRAISLWRLWEEKLPNRLGAMRGRTGERLFSVSGYADTRPVVVVQRTANDRAANRRIDIRFTEHRLSEQDIAAIRKATTPRHS